MTPVALILTNERDFTVDWVVRELQERCVSYARLNTESLAGCPVSVDVATDEWVFQRERDMVKLDGPVAILYRRPEPPRLSGLARSEATLAKNQWKALLRGLRSLRSVHWVSDPAAIDAAESKLLQLRTAAALGLRVPPTIVTNQKSAIVAFAKKHSDVVIKALDAPVLGPKSHPAFFFTHVLTDRDIDQLLSVEPAPMIVQKAILPKRDLRVTVVGARAFAAEAQSLTIDWRVSHQTTQFYPADLEPGLAISSVRLVHRLGLRFGAIDYVVDRDHEAHFLEINPNGEWGWLQNAGLPIAASIADELERGLE